MCCEAPLRLCVITRFFFLFQDTLMDEIRVQFVQLNEYVGNTYKLLQRSPFHFFDILQQLGCGKSPNGPPFTFRQSDITDIGFSTYIHQ